MSGLKIKSFGSQEPSSATDFSHLENNPNYNPEVEPTGDEPVEPTGDESDAGQPAVNEPEPLEPTGDEPAVLPEGEPEVIDEPINTPQGDSSLNDEPSGQPQLEVTEEMLLKSLSEKLGKEITSLDDLTPSPVELDPQVKAINDWKEKTGRPIEDFFKFQKDFTTVSDLDVAREFLQIEYPTLTKDEIALELEQFVPADDDLDNETAKKNLALKKYATKGRSVLETMKAELGEPSQARFTPEVTEQLDFAKNVKQQIEDNQIQQKAYFDNISKAAVSTDSMKLQLSDDLNIDFKISEDDKKTIPSFINEMPHWKTETGEWNHKAVVEDSIKIKHFDKIIKLAYEQGLNSGKDEVIKQAKNTTLGNTPSSASQQGQGTKKPKYEGLDKMLEAQTGTRLRFGK
jgi:hypothetical protein